MTRYRCDGLIVSTPPARPLYSLAAGGSRCDSDAEKVFELTPICPHTLSNRSVILGMSSVISVRVLSKRVETILTADRPTSRDAPSGYVADPPQPPHSAFCTWRAVFLQTLRRKLNWSGSHVQNPAKQNGQIPRLRLRPRFASKTLRFGPELSVMTVPKVLRDAPDISPATKARIRLMSQQMGYMPDSVAQGLRNRTTNSSGLVGFFRTNPVFARTITAIEEQAYDWATMWSSRTLPQCAGEGGYGSCGDSFPARGWPVFDPGLRLDPSVPLYEELLRRETPTVLLGHRPVLREIRERGNRRHLSELVQRATTPAWIWDIAASPSSPDPPPPRPPGTARRLPASSARG